MDCSDVTSINSMYSVPQQSTVNRNYQDDSIFETTNNQIDNNYYFQQMTEEEVNHQLRIYGMTPSNPDSFIFATDKRTYTDENGYNCVKYSLVGGASTVIKSESPDFLTTVSNILCNQSNETIIEEYDKYGNIEKTTQYLPDGTCNVKTYNQNGSVHREAVIYPAELNDAKRELSITTYQKDGSYCVTDISCDADETCMDNKANSSVVNTYYKKDGKIDFLTSFLGVILTSAFT